LQLVLSNLSNCHLTSICPSQQHHSHCKSDAYITIATQTNNFKMQEDSLHGTAGMRAASRTLTFTFPPVEQFSAEGLHTRSSSAEYFCTEPSENVTSSTCGMRKQYVSQQNSCALYSQRHRQEQCCSEAAQQFMQLQAVPVAAGSIWDHRERLDWLNAIQVMHDRHWEVHA
jgi:hypothetical protein